IGGGSGSVAIEWLLSHPTTEAITIEPRADRADRIRRNAMQFGVPRLGVVEGAAPEALVDLPEPDAVFVGGGLTEDVASLAWRALPPGGRLVANGVTLEAEALLTRLQNDLGGTLTRIELSSMGALGAKRAWKPAYPIVQWVAVK
ncbi:MAG: cobalamin biosynthesis bifunctional protein CbiET, partial [Rhodobacteraceae bacterium]|nr:cobalamin biosynthesis bifunctional protein CbiET [Paracoccaceae bacterium]